MSCTMRTCARRQDTHDLASAKSAPTACVRRPHRIPCGEVSDDTSRPALRSAQKHSKHRNCRTTAELSKHTPPHLDSEVPALGSVQDVQDAEHHCLRVLLLEPRLILQQALSC